MLDATTRVRNWTWTFELGLTKIDPMSRDSGENKTAAETELDLVLPGKMAAVDPSVPSKERLEQGLEKSLDTRRTTDTAHVVDLADESVRPTELVQPSMMVQAQPPRAGGVKPVVVMVLVALAFLLGVLVGWII